MGPPVGVKTLVCLHYLILIIGGSLSDIAFEDHCNEEVTFHAAEKLVVADWTKLRMRGSCSVNVTAIPDDADETGNQLLFSVLRLRTPMPRNSTIAREHERTEAATDEEVCPIIRLDILDAETGKNITPKGGLCSNHVPSKHLVAPDTRAILTLTFNGASNVSITPGSKLRLLAVRFHTNPCDDEAEFECDNSRCVAASLECNGDDDCGDDSDETDGCLMSTTVIVVIACVSTVFIIAIVTVIVFVLKRGRATGWGEAQLVNAVHVNHDEWSETGRVWRSSPGEKGGRTYGAT